MQYELRLPSQFVLHLLCGHKARPSADLSPGSVPQVLLLHL